MPQVAEAIEERERDREPPAELAYLWELFEDIARGRGGSGFGPNAIGYVEIDAYCRLLRVELEPWEVRLIRTLDNVFLKEAHDAHARAAKPAN